MLLIYPFCLVLRPLLYLTFEGKIRRRNTSSITTKRDSKCKTDLILFFFCQLSSHIFFLFCMLFLLAWTLGLFWPTWTQRANRQGTLINTRNNQTNYNLTHLWSRTTFRAPMKCFSYPDNQQKCTMRLDPKLPTPISMTPKWHQWEKSQPIPTIHR